MLYNPSDCSSIRQRVNVQCSIILLFLIYFFGRLMALTTSETSSSLSDILAHGDDLLIQGEIEQAIAVYRSGLLAGRNGENDLSYSTSSSSSSSSATPIVLLSLYTNLGTALSSLQTDQDNGAAIEAYQSALQLFREWEQHQPQQHQQHQQQQDDATAAAAEVTAIAVSAAFYLGMVYQDMGPNHAANAIEAYTLALELDDNHWSSAANRGSVQQDMLKDYHGALASYQRAYRILTMTTKTTTTTSAPPTDPPDEPHLVLSQLQYRIGLCILYSSSTSTLPSNDNAATTTTTCVIVPDDDSEHPQKNRPADYCRQHAAHAFSLAVQYDPTNELAKHMLASLTADASLARASNAYVTALFDDYAATFEHSLVSELRYDGFARLRRGFDRAMAMTAAAASVNTVTENGRPNDNNGPTIVTKNNNNNNNLMFDTVLDAGCGTGLAGEQFRNISSSLIGVDLSQAILDQANLRRPGLYDEVIVGDVIQVLHEKARSLSLIIAADSFIYFGNLDPLLAALYIGLSDDDDNNDGGLVAFTLENVSVDDEQVLTAATKSDWRWQLTASGRFAHRKDYVYAAAHQHGFAVLHYESLTDFRFESGVGVRGHLFVLRKLTRPNSNDEL